MTHQLGHLLVSSDEARPPTRPPWRKRGDIPHTAVTHLGVWDVERSTNPTNSAVTLGLGKCWRPVPAEALGTLVRQPDVHSPQRRLPLRVVSDSHSTLAGWLQSNPPSRERFGQTVAGVSERHRGGESFFVAVRELLDEAALLHDDVTRTAALRDQPELTGDPRYDAYLAALTEHLSASWGVVRPAWTCEPSRFLQRFWFVSPVPGFRALLLAQSPAAFRRRGIFISSDSLRRV